jgi:PqqD family protein of HPr-rel-A system
MGMTGEDRVWQVRPGLLYRALVDGGMIYDGESGQVHHLNATAAQVWELCQPGATSAALVEALCRRYAVEDAQAQADVGKILQHFADACLLQP